MNVLLLIVFFLWIPARDRVSLNSVIIEKQASFLLLSDGAEIYRVPIADGLVKTEVYQSVMTAGWTKGRCHYETRDTSFCRVDVGRVGQYLHGDRVFTIDCPTWQSIP